MACYAAEFSELHKTTKPNDVEQILILLPHDAQQSLKQYPNLNQLVEVVMDFGRPPKARFPNDERTLSDHDVTLEHIQEVCEKIGSFGHDNRAGIDRSLHRISCIRNRQGKIIGLTCRVGRDVPNSSRLIEDLAKEGKSILLLGAPGVGKTTVIRSLCKYLSDQAQKRVMIVDSSNEIAGDGDIPHASIGSSRRLQVSHPNNQHAVMIEAVENHTPQVLVIDEIGVSKECEAAQIISRRGVQLVATAHGKKLNEAMEDPVLRNLLGGTQAVIIGDAALLKRTGTTSNRLRKTVIERKGNPVFDVIVEMTSQNDWIVYNDVPRAVDQILNGQMPTSQRRFLKTNGSIGFGSLLYP